MKSRPEAAGRVLMVRYSSLGDVVLATAAAERLWALGGGRTVTFLTRVEWAPVLYGHPAIELVIAHRGKGGGDETAAPPDRGLSPGDFEGMIDLHGNLRSRMLALRLGLPHQVRYRGAGWRRRALVHFPALARRRRRGGTPYGVVEAYVEAVDRYLGLAGPHPPAPAPRIHLTPTELGWASREFARLELPARPVGLCPGARHATKRWPVEYYAELIDRLAARGQAAVPVFLSNSREDLAVEAALRRRVRRPEALRVLRLPIRRAAAMIAACRSVVTNDSGLMHVAGAVGTRVVALFGPTVAEFGFHPRGAGDLVLERPLACRPCSLHGGRSCPRGHFRCLREIAPEDVLLAVQPADNRPARTS